MTSSTKLDMARLRAVTHGMLSPAVYEHIYQTALNAPDGDIVEIGTAHGGATIALASGKKDSGTDGHVHTIEKILGGSRERYGGIDENKAIIQSNFEIFSVTDRITLHIGSSEEIAPVLNPNMKLSVLMMDADGAIDRDFGLFYNALTPGGVIIIDDYAPEVFLRRQNKGIFVDQKHRLTYLLVNYFRYVGLIENIRQVDNTCFAVKPAHQDQDVDFSAYDTRPIYRQLIFAHARLHNAMAEKIGVITSRFPRLHEGLKKIYFTVCKR